MPCTLLAVAKSIAAVVFTLCLTVGCSSPSPHAAPSLSENPTRQSLFSDFLALRDGPAPTKFTSGQPASLAPRPPGWEPLTIENGRLTLDTNSTERRAGYIRTPDMGRPITRMGMEWTVTAKPGGGPGVAAMGITGSPVDPLARSSLPIAMHFLVQRDGWNFSVSPGPVQGDPRLITVAQGDFDPPLVEDGVTVNRVDVAINGQQATIELPNGSVTRISDPRIAAWAGRYGFFEAYAEAGSLDGKVGFTRIWANA